MKKMEELTELLCKELDKYADKRNMTAGDLDIVNKLSDSIKNIYKIEMLEGGENYDDDMSYGRGMSMARGRGENYSNSRYSMNNGGYSNRGYSRDDGYSMRRSYSRDSHDDLMEYLGEKMRGATEEEQKILRDTMRKFEDMK